MLSAQAEWTNQTYADRDKTQDQQKNVPSPPPSTNKRKAEVEINNIDKELYYMNLTGSVISAIYGMVDIPDDAWKIGL